MKLLPLLGLSTVLSTLVLNALGAPVCKIQFKITNASNQTLVIATKGANKMSQDSSFVIPKSGSGTVNVTLQDYNKDLFLDVYRDASISPGINSATSSAPNSQKVYYGRVNFTYTYRNSTGCVQAGAVGSTISSDAAGQCHECNKDLAITNFTPGSSKGVMLGSGSSSTGSTAEITFVNSD